MKFQAALAHQARVNQRIGAEAARKVPLSGAQMLRLWHNTKELQPCVVDGLTFAQFARVVRYTESVHQIT